MRPSQLLAGLLAMTSVTAAMPDAFANIHGLGDVKNIFARQDDSTCTSASTTHAMLTHHARICLGFRTAIEQPAHTDDRSGIRQGQRHQQRQERRCLDNREGKRKRLAKGFGQ